MFLIQEATFASNKRSFLFKNLKQITKNLSKTELIVANAPSVKHNRSKLFLIFKGSGTVYSGLEGSGRHEARMIKSDYTGQYPVDAVTIEKFAELIGKTDEAVRLMIKREKLPVVDFQDPNKPNSRVSETWIYLSEFNRIVREAYFNRPAKERDAWLKWLGL